MSEFIVDRMQTCREWRHVSGSFSMFVTILRIRSFNSSNELRLEELTDHLDERCSTNQSKESQPTTVTLIRERSSSVSSANASPFFFKILTNCSAISEGYEL